MSHVESAAERIRVAACPEDLFGSDPTTVNNAFRALAKVVHPDHHPLARLKEVATKAFQRLNELKQQADHKVADGTYGDRKPAAPPKRKIIRLAGDQLELGALLRAGDIADVYAATLLKSGRQVVAKIARSPKDNDLIRGERETLPKLDALEPKARRYFAELAKGALDVAGRCGNLLVRYPQHVALDQIRARAKLGFRDMAWMLRRMLEGLGHLHRCGIVHGNLIPPNLLFNPADHGLRIVDWCYAVPIGTPGRAKSAGWNYPTEVGAKQPLTPATDIFMAVACARWMLAGGASDEPPALRRFLGGCLLENASRRPTDAWGLHEELGELLQRLVGPPKFHRLDLGVGESFT